MNSVTIRLEKASPQKLSHGGRSSRWPFRQMKVGDSFVVPGTKGQTAHELAAHPVRSAASMWKRRNPDFNYTIQTTPDGLRCFRIAKA